MSLLSQLIIRISADSSGVLAGTRAAEGGLNSLNRTATTTGARLDRSMANAGRRMTTVGRTATRNLTFPILAAGAASVKMAVDFDTSMRQISALVGASDKQMTQYRAGILELGREVPQAPKELAEALYFVTSSGFEGAAALDVLRASARAAATGLAETQTMADVVTSAVNAYGEENLSAARSVDIILAAVREGKVEGEQFAQSIGRIIPLGAELGVSFDQVAGALAAMSLSGLDAAEGTTALRGIFTQILKPAAQSEAALKKIGLSAQGVRDSLGERGLLPTLLDLKARLDLSDKSLAQFNKTMDDKGALAAVKQFKDENKGVSDALGKLFPNVRALAGFLNLVGRNADKNAKAISAVGDSVGDADKALKEAAKGDRFQFQKKLNLLRIAAIELGEDLMPIAKDVVGFVTGLAESFSNLDPNAQRNVLKLAAALAAFGPVVRFGGGLITVARGIRAVNAALAGGAAVSAGASALSAGAATVAGGAAATGGAAAAGAGLSVAGAAATGIGIVGVGVAKAKMDFDANKASLDELSDWVKKVGVDAAIASGEVRRVGGELHRVTSGGMGGWDRLRKINPFSLTDTQVGDAAELRAAHQKQKTNPFAAAIAPLETQLGILRAVNGQLSKGKQLELDRLVAAGDYKDAVKLVRGEVEKSTESFVKNNKRQWDQVDGWRAGAAATKRSSMAMKNFRKSGTETMLAMNKVYGNSTASANKLDQANREVGHGWESIAPKADSAAGATDRAGGSADRAGNKASGAKGKVDGLGRSLDSLKSPPPINITANIGDAMAKIAAVKGALSGIAGNTSLGMTGLGPSGRAAGGPVKAGWPYIVGEKGPELMIPKTPGIVIPNHKLKTSTPSTGFGRAGGAGRGPLQAVIKHGVIDIDVARSKGYIQDVAIEIVDGADAYEAARARTNR